MPVAATSIGSLPASCAASVWKSAPASAQRAPISRIGCNAPISLLAPITETRAVSGRIDCASRSRSTTPSACTGMVSASKPLPASAAAGASTLLCSMAETRIWRRFVRSAVPSRLILLDSVAPPVRMISPGAAPMSSATAPHASSTAAAASQPSACSECGLPNRSSRNGSMALRTSGSSGVVA